MASPVASKWNHKQSGRMGCLARKNHRFRPSLHGITGTVSLPVILVGGLLVSWSLPVAATGGTPKNGEPGQAWIGEVLHAPYPFSFIYGNRSSNESYRAGGRIVARNCSMPTAPAP